MNRIRHTAVSIGGSLFLMLAATAAHAQFLSHNYKCDFGVQAGTQPPPGWYVAAAYVRYGSDTLRDNDGNRITVESLGRVNVVANGYAAGVWRVTNYKILGGNYSFMAFPALTDNNLEAPALGFEQQTRTGFTDTYFQPINLGWHTQRADYMAGFGLYAPTGSYDPDAPDNLGLGMWTFEFFGGTTQYFDQKKSWHAAVLASYETHTKKRNTDIRVGDILTLEGGVGKSFLDGGLTLGLALEAQWKITADTPGQDLQPVFDSLGIEKHRVYGLGPEITIPIASQKKLYGFVNVRYVWETGVRNTVEGDSFSVILSLPIPGVPLG